MQYTSGDAAKILSFTPILNGLELQQPASNVFTSRLPKRRKATAMVCIFAFGVGHSSHFYLRLSDFVYQIGNGYS